MWSLTPQRVKRQRTFSSWRHADGKVRFAVREALACPCWGDHVGGTGGSADSLEGPGPGSRGGPWFHNPPASKARRQPPAGRSAEGHASPEHPGDGTAEGRLDAPGRGQLSHAPVSVRAFMEDADAELAG